MEKFVKIKVRGTKKDIEEVFKPILKELHKKYVVTPTSRYQEDNLPGQVHIFYRIQSFPRSALAGLGDCGRDE